MEKSEVKKAEHFDDVKVKSAKIESVKIPVKLVWGVVIGIVVVAAIIGLNYESSPENVVAATVNGEVITIDDLNRAYDSLPVQYAGAVSKTELLNQLIETKVFYQEAEKEGIVVSEEEAGLEISQIKVSSGMSDEDFAANFLKGITEKELTNQYAKQLTVQKFLEDNFLSQIEVSEEEAEEFYKGNPEQFKVAEQVVAKHILIGDSDLTEDEQDAKAELLLSEITKTNFCDYVEDYTTDTASIENCGEYTFPRDAQLVEEFKQLAFEQKAGQMGIVRTQFGPHIIWTVKKIPARTVLYTEAKEQVMAYLKTQKEREEYDGFYQNLAKDSDIQIEFSEV